MNLSLRNRIAASFIVANLVVLVLAFTVFHFLNSLNREVESITVESNKLSLLTDEIRITAVSILKYQRRLLIRRNQESPSLVNKVIGLCESFTLQLQRLDSLYRDPNVKKIVERMLTYVDSLKLILSKALIYSRDQMGLTPIEELSDKILEAFTDFQEIQYSQSLERDRKIKDIVSKTKRNMMITLIIAFLGTIILGLVVPGKIALPFKKIKDAIRELQDCNFDVSIFYDQDDEIGDLAREMNKMIYSIKVFDELRANRISIENRKFDALANMVKRAILVANSEGKLIYMNNRLYSLLKVQSEDVIGKDMTDSVIPKAIIECYQQAINRQSKIENAKIVISTKKTEVEDATKLSEQATMAAKDDLSSTVKPSQVKEVLEEVLFSGYANVTPIRGKESSLDYYLMVLSVETI